MMRSVEICANLRLQMKGRLKILALITLKLAVAMAFLIYLAQTLNWNDIVSQLQLTSYPTIFILLLGSIIGVLIEGLRWKIHVSDPSFGLNHAVRSVGMGLTVSVFLPGGSGGIASRVLQLPSNLDKERWKLVAQATFWQWSAIWHLGLIGYSLRLIFLGESPLFWLAFFSFSLAVAIYLLKSEKLKAYKWLSYIAFPRGGLALLFLSVFRYIVYGSVLWLAIQLTPAFSHLPLSLFLPLILLSFSLQFVLPVLPLLELGLRSSVMIWVFSPFLDSASQMVVWAFLLWFFNLIIPAVFGLFFGWLWFWKS